jgi:hypothetical protein
MSTTMGNFFFENKSIVGQLELSIFMEERKKASMGACTFFKNKKQKTKNKKQKTKNSGVMTIYEKRVYFH